MSEGPQDMAAVRLERDWCVASGQCVMLAPEVFDQDDDGIALLLTQSPDANPDGVANAVRVCPAAAISVEE
jgi:ferredoxin